MATPEEALALTAPTDEFLCPLAANVYGIEFLSFRIRDPERNRILFEMKTDPYVGDWEKLMQGLESLSLEEQIPIRTVQYEFPSSVLELNHVGTELVFKVGDRPVPNFRLIERHYFQDRLLKSFDFQFPFCMPNSTNSWEIIYQLPKLTRPQIEEIVNRPFESVADSFYYVDGKLVIHTKSFFSYVAEQDQQV